MPTIENDYLHFALILSQYGVPRVFNEKLTPEKYQQLIVKDVRELILAHRKLHRWAEEDCNRGLTDKEQAQEKSCQNRIVDLLHPYCINPIFGGDPRGCIFKMKLPDGRTNDFGREGWCVPR